MNYARYVGQHVITYCNQNDREATVLAILDGRALIEYCMPRGTTALRIVDCVYGYTVRRVSYKTVPVKWIRELYAQESEWEGRPQGEKRALSIPDLYAKKVGRH